MRRNGRRIIAWIVGVVLLLFAGLLIFAVYSYFGARQAEPITTSIAVPKAAPVREVKDIVTNSSGDLIITYTDGSVQNAGRVVGEAGQDGQVPSQAQLSAALIEYCANGRCDAKSPTQEQIMQAITAYCLSGICKGSNGADATPITAEQIAAAVNTYCSDGRCKGSTGQPGEEGPVGPTGATGDTTVLSCVIRSTNNVATRYIAWRYSLEPDTAYRDLYKLPVWAECSNPVDLRGNA